MYPLNHLAAYLALMWHTTGIVAAGVYLGLLPTLCTLQQEVETRQGRSRPPCLEHVSNYC